MRPMKMDQAQRMTTDAMHAAIGAMGRSLGPDVLAACRALYDAEQTALMAAVPAAASDMAYGPDARHRLDIYGGGTADDLRPILLFVHGGGFLVGDKGGDAAWPNASVGRMAACRGLLGAVMNYRLAPGATWPAGGEDVLAALDWLVAHGANHGGDPARIVVMGTSAGAVHVATALQMRPDLPARGLILLSGLYGYTNPEDRDLLYFGDAALYPDRAPRKAVVATDLPLMVAMAQHDPVRFQTEFAGLLADRLARHGTMPHLYHGSGHNHYTLAMHLGTRDTALADAIDAFVAQCCVEI